MNAVEAERLPKRPRPKMPPAKGSELLGLVLATAALLLLASLASYHPGDPSFLHELPPSRARVDNFAGVFGAELAALLLGLLGTTALLLPLGLAAGAWSLLRRRERRGWPAAASASPAAAVAAGAVAAGARPPRLPR